MHNPFGIGPWVQPTFPGCWALPCVSRSWHLRCIAGSDSGSVRSLSHEEMKLVHGGRAMSVLVGGRPGGVVDDFQLNMAIFSGDIGVRVV